MGKSYLQLKIVAVKLEDLNELICQYEKLGFIHDGISQDNGDVYWTFMQINNGLVEETNGDFVRKEDGTLEPAKPLVMCCEYGETRQTGCYETNVKDYIRNSDERDGSSWDDEPISLCDKHSKGHKLYINNTKIY